MNDGMRSTRIGGRGRGGILAAAVIALAGVLIAGACEMTRTRDGGIIIHFAPDMVVTAMGYEDALSQVNDLIEGCVTGVPRTCTPQELHELGEAHDRIVKAKGQLYANG